jgi:hypothetical protein
VLVELQLEEVDKLLLHKVEVVGLESQYQYLFQYRRLLQSLLQDRQHYDLHHQ